MRRPLTAAVLLLALGGAWGGAWGGASAAPAQTGAPLPATPRLPSFGKGLFSSKAPERSASDKLPDRPTLLRGPATTLAGREATLQILQDCYAREAPRVAGSGAAETRVRRLRQLCENEEIADTRAWLKWSKLSDSRQSRKIVDAIQEDDAEKALAAAATPLTPEKS